MNALVQAMAALHPPIGQLSLASSHSQVLTPVSAANWQSYVAGFFVRLPMKPLGAASTQGFKPRQTRS